MQASLGFERILEEVNGQFKDRDFVPVSVVDDELKARATVMARGGYKFDSASLDALKAYLEGYGILLAGDTGTGKTSFFRALGIEIVSMIDICAHHLDDIVSCIEALRDEEIVVDDIGVESVYSNYGCKMDILPWLIEKRMSSEMRTHFTTNLTGDALAKRYGARVVDRIFETCKSFRFAGKSKRKTRVNAACIKTSFYSDDWVLCSERCSNFKDGIGCAFGIKVPPHRDENHPHPPEECVTFSPIK